MLDVLEPPTLPIVVGGWQPDPRCIAAGDEHALLALRCWAAARLSDAQITRRILDLAGACADVDTPEFECWSAAWAVARHAVWCGLPAKRVARLLGRLSVLLPGSPDQPDEIASITRAAISEVGHERGAP
jgi:hypothetical protein